MNDPTNIYFARGEESRLIKIGASCHVPNRMQGLARRWEEQVTLLATVRAVGELEFELHDLFAALIVPERGREWFRDDGSITELIACVPVEQQGAGVFVPLGDRRPLKYPTSNLLYWPTRPFPAWALSAVGITAAARAA